MAGPMATPNDVGRPCPYCRFPLKEGAPVHVCESCGSVHHAECWADGGGCAVFGCLAAGTAAVASAPAAAAPPQAYAAPPTDTYAAPTAYQQPPAAQPRYASPPPPGPQDKQPANPGTRPLIIALAVVVALAGIAVGVAVAGGAFSSNGNAAKVVTVHQQVKSHTTANSMTPGEEQQKRGAIVGVLNEYQRFYSEHNTSGLGSIFTDGIKRHGLSGSGCSVVEGRQPVLEDYEQQFEAGSGTYTLVGLSPNQVRLHGPSSASVHSHYEIAPGGSGFVNFRLSGGGPNWRISEVYATCA